MKRDIAILWGVFGTLLFIVVVVFSLQELNEEPLSTPIPSTISKQPLEVKVKTSPKPLQSPITIEVKGEAKITVDQPKQSPSPIQESPQESPSVSPSPSPSSLPSPSCGIGLLGICL